MNTASSSKTNRRQGIPTNSHHPSCEFDDEVNTLMPNATAPLCDWIWDSENNAECGSPLTFKNLQCKHCFHLLQTDVVVPEQFYELHHLIAHMHTETKYSTTRKNDG